MGKLTNTVSGNIASFRSADKANIESLKVNFLPKMEGTGDPSPTNIRNITGWTGCTLRMAEKNMGHIYGYSASSINSPTGTRSLIGSYGTTINTINYTLPDTSLIITQENYSDTSIYSYRNGYVFIGVDNLIFGEKYNISFKVSNIVSNPREATLNDIRLVVPSGGFNSAAKVENNKIIFKNVTFAQLASRPEMTGFDIRICGMSFTLSEFMVTQASDYCLDMDFKPYTCSEITYSWNDKGTIYGGYLDIIKGKLVAEYELLTDTWGNWGTAADQGDGTTLRYKKFTNPVYGNGITNHYTDYCNVAKYVYANENGTTHYYIVGQSYNCRVYLPNDFSTDQIIQVVGKLIEPIEYDLTPAEFKTFIDYNNYWSNTNSTTVVEYDIVDYMSKRRISMNSPHIKSATGNTASFTSTFRGCLAECNTSFDPIQSGSGDPSTTNIRPINGIKTVNFYNDSYYSGFINWNQLQIDGNFANREVWEVGNDYGSLSFADNVATWTCVNQPTQFYHTGFRIVNGTNNSNFLSIPYNHKVLVMATVKCSIATRFRIYGLVSTTGNTYIYSYIYDSLQANTWTDIAGFISDRPETPPSAATDVIIKRFKPVLFGTNGDISTVTVGTTFDIKNFMAFDLTQMFGAGNEPTVEQFKALFNLSLYKTFNIGTKTTVSAINGIDPAFATVAFPVMKNILNIDQMATINPGASGSTITVSNGVISIDAIAGSARTFVVFAQEFSAGTYTIQAKGSGAVANRKLLTDVEITGSSFNSYYNMYQKQLTSDSLTFTLPSTSKIGLVLANKSGESGNPASLYDIQLESGLSASEYEPYKTVYGGYVDPVKGKLIATYKGISLKNKAWYRYTANQFCINTDKDLSSKKVWCDMFPISATNGYPTDNKSIGFYSNGANYGHIIFIRYNDSDDVNDFKTWIQSLDKDPYLVYQLATPIEYNITPQRLKNMIGSNNIFSDTNGNTTVKYWTY